MSGAKRVLMTFSVIVIFIAIAYFTLEIPYSKSPASKDLYLSEYLLGFSIPLIGSGLILLTGIQLVLRTKKRIVKKINRQIPAV